MKLIATLALALSLAPVTLAGDVFVVDEALGAGADFSNLPAAVAAAQDGDVVLVRSGTYSGVVLDDLGISIVEDGGATAVISGSVVVRDLGAGKDFLLSGVDVRPDISVTAPSLRLANNAGTVVVQDCTVLPPRVFFLGQWRVDGGVVGTIANCGKVVIVRSDVGYEGIESSAILSSPGLIVVASSVSAYESTFRGGIGLADDALPGHPGMVVRGSSVFASECAILGGSGGGATGIHSSVGSPGGPGVLFREQAGGPAAALTERETTIDGGPGGPAFCCGNPPASDGPPTSGPGTVQSTGTLGRSVGITSPARTGDPITITLEGEVGDASALYISFLSDAVPLAGFDGIVHVGAPAFAIFPGFVPASGQRVIAGNLIDWGVPGVRVYAQGLFFNATEGYVFSNMEVQTALAASVP